MKTNFRKTQDNKPSKNRRNEKEKKLTKDEFEEVIRKSGAKGSFMIFRSKNKNDELGIDQL